jgi:hypothetical protein
VKGATKARRLSPAAIELRNALICRLKCEGMTDLAISRRARCTVAVVKTVCYRLREDTIPVPGWVPSHLHFDYRAIAVEDGEEAAASYARNRKRAQVSSGSLECGGC